MIKNQNQLGGIYMILSVLFFSLMDILIKITNEYDVGQVMFAHHSDQVSQRSQVSGVALCMSKLKVPSVSEWQNNPKYDKLSRNFHQ